MVDGMPSPSPILLPGRAARKAVQLEELVDAWILAAHEATQALRAWAEVAPGDRRIAHAVYRAALDREESAADALMVARARHWA
jgi:hypothetical protein